MRQARSGLSALVDQRVDIAGVSLSPQPPGLCRERPFDVVELRARPDMPAAVHDDLLPLERGVEVRDDAHPPVAVRGQHERLRRRHLLVAGAKRTQLELAGRWWLERRTRSARAPGAAGSDHGNPARLGIAPKLAAQLAARSAFSRKGRIRSTGAGKMIVEELAPPISSRVCR